MEGRGRSGGARRQSVPVRNEHVHFFLPEAEIPKAQAWYAKTFGGKAGTRNNAPVVDLPGVQLRFTKADKAQAPTKARWQGPSRRPARWTSTGSSLPRPGRC